MNMTGKIESYRLEDLLTNQLPSLLPGTPGLIKSLSNEGIEFSLLVETIERFPGIAGRLISLANSAWSAPVTPITSLEKACSRLGFEVVKSTSIALAVAAPFNPARCPSFDPQHFWTFALMSAEVADTLAGHLNSNQHDLQRSTVRTAAILHSLGLLWLVDKIPLELDRILSAKQQNPDLSLSQSITSSLGFNQAQASGALGKHWGLPSTLLAVMENYLCVDYQAEHHQLVNCVGLAVNLASTALRCEDCASAEDYRRNLGLDQDELATTLLLAKEKQDKISLLAETLFAA